MKKTLTDPQAALLFHLDTYIKNAPEGVKTISVTDKQYKTWQTIQEKAGKWPDLYVKLKVYQDSYRGYEIHKYGTERKLVKSDQKDWVHV